MHAELRVLVATDRLALQPIFTALGSQQRDMGVRNVYFVSSRIDSLGTHLDQIAVATLAVVDLPLCTPYAFDALELCRHLQVEWPDLPVAGLLCCPHALTQDDLESLRAAGVRSLLDLYSPPDVLLRALYSIARGDVIWQVHLSHGADLPLRGMFPGASPSNADSTFTGQAPSVHSLSDSDIQIIRLVASGLPYTEIGSKLCLSQYTVKHRVARLRRRLGFDSREALVTWAAQHGYCHSTDLDRDWSLPETNAF